MRSSVVSNVFGALGPVSRKTGEFFGSEKLNCNPLVLKT